MNAGDLLRTAAAVAVEWNVASGGVPLKAFVELIDEGVILFVTHESGAGATHSLPLADAATLVPPLETVITDVFTGLADKLTKAMPPVPVVHDVAANDVVVVSEPPGDAQP